MTMDKQRIALTITKRASIALAICGCILLVRLCVARLLGIHYPDPGGEATVFQGAFLIVDFIFSAISMIPWALLSRSHTANLLYWQWYFALDFLIFGLIWGVTEAFYMRYKRSRQVER
jgi:hypothetical protein